MWKIPVFRENAYENVNERIINHKIFAGTQTFRNLNFFVFKWLYRIIRTKTCIT